MYLVHSLQCFETYLDGRQEEQPARKNWVLVCWWRHLTGALQLLTSALWAFKEFLQARNVPSKSSPAGTPAGFFFYWTISHCLFPAVGRMLSWPDQTR